MMGAHAHDEDDDVAGLLAEEGQPKRQTWGMCACLSVEYYRPYFDINTDEVVSRVKQALVVCDPNAQFLDVVRAKPDAYGPWWISTTLIFVISVTSQLKSLKGEERYDFGVVTLAAFTIYSYLGIAAVSMWLALNYWLKVPLTLLQCVCLVGYSLTIYVPASLICVLDVISRIFCWTSLLAACTLSSLFVAKSTMPILDHHEKHHIAGFVAGLVSINVILMFVVRLSLYG